MYFLNLVYYSRCVTFSFQIILLTKRHCSFLSTLFSYLLLKKKDFWTHSKWKPDKINYIKKSIQKKNRKQKIALQNYEVRTKDRIILIKLQLLPG